MSEQRGRDPESQADLMRDEGHLRARLTGVLHEIRQLERDARAARPADERAARLRELHSQESRLHDQLRALRQRLERARDTGAD